MNLKKINKDVIDILIADKTAKKKLGFAFSLLDDGKKVFFSNGVMFVLVKAEDFLIDISKIDQEPFTSAEDIVKQANYADDAYFTNMIEVVPGDKRQEVRKVMSGDRWEWINEKFLGVFDKDVQLKMASGRKYNMIYVFENGELAGGVLPVYRGDKK